MAIENNQENRRYNLFGKPNNSVVVKPGVNASGVGGVGTGGQTSTGNVEAPREEVSPTTSNNIGNSGVKNGGGDAIRNVGSEAAGVGAPSKAAVVGNPVRMQEPSYVQRLGQQQEAQKRTYVPDAENKGRGVARFLSNVFGGGNKAPKTKEESRREIQKISVLRDTLSHLANLWWVAERGATPQNIQSSAAVNEAKWKAEDALEAQQEKANREWALKQQKQQDDAAYKAGMMGLSAERNEIAKGNFELSKNRDARADEMQKVNITAKQAGLDKQKHDMELADKKFEADQKQRGIQNSLAKQRLSLGWANHNLAALREARNAGKGTGNGKSVGKKGDGSATFVTPSAVKYTLSKDFQKNIGQVYDSMVKKGIIAPIVKMDDYGKEYNARPSHAEMINEVMKAADTRQGHDDFVWWGKRLGYKYEGGMTHEVSNRVGGGIGYKGASI